MRSNAGLYGEHTVFSNEVEVEWAEIMECNDL
jgi:hypothetical protein